MSEYRETVQELLEEIKSFRTELKEHKVNSLRGAFDTVAFVVKFVENSAVKGKIAKADKKQFATDLINELVDIPMIPEIAEEKVIGVLIEAVVAFANQHFGKLWVAKSN